MEIQVDPSGWLTWPGGRVRCSLGRGGVRHDKHEGDGASPIGSFPLRRVLWRADRLPKPQTGLPLSAIAEDDGWCDEPTDPAYNQPVKRPHPTSHEELWRQDGVYDVIVVMGHNDEPVVPGLGSAVFMHIARLAGSEPESDSRAVTVNDGQPWRATAGCVALARHDLLQLLADCDPGTILTIRALD